jgi:thiamine pyrophosphate-dependent acetolactate synthase large subunit-like protein
MGAMGCILGIGLGVALNTKKTVRVIIGDGALLMKLGSLATILAHAPKNLKILVINNSCHESCGGQKTNFDAIKHLFKDTLEIINIEPGSRKDLPRIDKPPWKIVHDFRYNIYT